MSKLSELFKNVTSAHIVAAIKEYDSTPPEALSKYKSKSTFLLYAGKQYNAKHILRLAYRKATGKSISEDDPFNGGPPTIRVLRNLGFEVLHTPQSRD